MIKYPPVKHKLPKIFEEIIKADNLKELLFVCPTPRLDVYKELKKNRLKLTQGAEKFIQRQKGP